MRPRPFLEAIPERVRPLLTSELQGFQSRQQWSLVKLWFDDPKLHYEAWIHGRIELLEIGLHFESDAATNARMLELFEDLLIVAKAEISERVEAEPWDKGWARVYEMLPLATLDADYLDRVAQRVARFISVLEPIRCTTP